MSISLRAKIGSGLLGIFLGVALLGYVVHQARHSARDMKNVWNLQQLALAMQNYHSTHGRLPPAVVYGTDGSVLLSWRVLLLPFLGEEELYQQFRRDEPWDSPHNHALLARMPEVYGPFQRGASAEPYATFYQVFTGDRTAFEGGEGLRIPEDFPNGIAETLLIVEAGHAVPWTKPEDLPYAPHRPLPALGGISKRGFRGAFVAGFADFFDVDFSEAALRGLITRNGREKLLR